MLSMITAPFRRKSTPTLSTTTPKETPNSTRASTASPTSAVNCMHNVPMCASSDWFSNNNNIYAEFEFNANDSDRIPIASSINCDLTHSNVQTVATATLALPDDDDEDNMKEAGNQLNTSIAVEDEEHLTSVSLHESEVECLYECGPNPCREAKTVDEMEANDSKESLSSDTLSKTNKFFSSLSKSLRSKLKQKQAPVSETSDTVTQPSEACTCPAVKTNAEQAFESDGTKSVPTLAIRLRDKIRKLNFVKNRPNSDDEVSRNA